MQRFGRVGRGTGFICVTLSLLATGATSVRYLTNLRAGGLSNPDSYMRLVRLRDMVDGGAILDTVARDGSGHGTVVHWSHLIDSLLCLLAVPFSLFMRPDDALHAAALIFGPLNLAALSYAVIWAAAPFAERKWLFLGAVLPALSPAIISYGMAGVVHHHVTVAVVTVACWGWAARLIAGLARSTAGIALGTWAALGLWFTPESVPLTMMSFGALGLAWIVDTKRTESRDGIASAIALTGLSFAAVTTLALLVDPPAEGFGAMEIDRLSMPFSGLATAVAVTGAGLWVVHRMTGGPGRRAAAAGAIGLTCAAAWVAAFHGALFGANMLLDEGRRNAMFGHINEMLPIAGALPALHFLLTGALAALMAIASAVKTRSLVLGYAAACLAGLLVLGWSHVRFAAYPEAAGAIALPIALTMVAGATVRWHQIGQSFARLAIILLFVQVPYLGQLPELTGSAYAAPIVLPACRVADATAMLAAHPGAVVLADVNDTPEILYKTQVRTVGSLYHRDLAGFLRLRAAWRVPPSATVPAEIDAAEISLVLGCETPARSPLVEDIASTTLLDQLRTGNPPPWLRRISENTASGQALYEVVRPAEGRKPGDLAQLNQ
jgi:hypothetical protein